MSKVMLSHFRRWFFSGILITAPLALTIYVTWALITFIDDQVASLLPAWLDPQFYVGFPLPGYGMIIAAICFILIGALTAGILGKLILTMFDRLANRVPLVRSLYGGSKQILETIMASQSDAFREVVLVEYPRRGIWAIGFVTGVTKGEVQALSKENLINVFVPTTPNPTSGFLLFFKRDDTLILDMSVEEAVKMVVSGGIVTPEDPNKNREAVSLTELSGGE
jgi:uncharacterized membrane protein